MVKVKAPKQADILSHCRLELIGARDDAAMAYDRCAALAELVDEVARREVALNRPLQIEELQEGSEEDKARIRSLVLRAFPEKSEREEPRWSDPQQPL